ncbi:MAG: hypothetical protein U1F66_09010 [bacterium]
MRKFILNGVRALLVMIPVAFVFSAVFATCGNGNAGPCSGDVNVSTVSDCQNYSSSNDCDSFTFENGVCNVVNCQNCEVIVDDIDPVIDVDDPAF